AFRYQDHPATDPGRGGALAEYSPDRPEPEKGGLRAVRGAVVLGGDPRPGQARVALVRVARWALRTGRPGRRRRAVRGAPAVRRRGGAGPPGRRPAAAISLIAGPFSARFGAGAGPG